MVLAQLVPGLQFVGHTNRVRLVFVCRAKAAASMRKLRDAADSRACMGPAGTWAPQRTQPRTAGLHQLLDEKEKLKELFNEPLNILLPISARLLDEG